MNKKISFKKKLIPVGTSFGIIIERPLLSLLDINSDNIKEDNIILKVTIERTDKQVNINTLEKNVDTLLELIENKEENENKTENKKPKKQ